MREMDEYFKDAAAELREFHLADLPSNAPKHTFSPQFELSMRRMIEHERLSHKGAQLSALVKRTLGKVLAGVIAIAAAVVCVGMWSGTFFKTISEDYPDYVQFSLPGILAQVKVSVPLTYELTAIPQGFRRVRHARDPKGFLNYTLLENDSGQVISFEQTPAGNEPLEAANASEDLGEITLPLGVARLRKESARYTIEWQANDYQFMIYTTLPQEQVIALAESVKLKISPVETMQTLPIEAVPLQYPQALAKQNGDIVLANGALLEGAQKLNEFLIACEQNQSAVVRLTEYIGSGVVIHDLETSGGRIYYTHDEYRRPSSSKPWEQGETYEDISLLSSEGKHVLLLHTRRHTDPIKVLQYN